MTTGIFCQHCGADLKLVRGAWECPECKLHARIRHLEASLREIASNCEDVAHSPVVSRQEARAWRAVAKKARAFLEKKP